MNLVSDRKSLNLGAPLHRDTAANSLQDLAKYSQAQFGQNSDYWETDSESSDGYTSDSSSELDFQAGVQFDDYYKAMMLQSRPPNIQQTFDWYGAQPKKQQKRKESEQRFFEQPTLHWNGLNWYVPHLPNISLQNFTYNKDQKFQQIFNNLPSIQYANPYIMGKKTDVEKPQKVNKQKKQTSKHITQKPLQQNPNQWEFRTKRKQTDEHEDEKGKKPTFFNSKTKPQTVQDQLGLHDTIQQQKPKISSPTQQASQIQEESPNVSDKICNDSPKSNNYISKELPNKIDKIREESPKHLLNRDDIITKQTKHSSESGQILINRSEQHIPQPRRGEYIINLDIYTKPKEVQTKLLLSKFQHFNPQEIRFKLLQRLIDSHDENKYHNFNSTEIQLINQLSSLYQGELELRSLQERVLLTNTLNMSEFENYFIGKQSNKAEPLHVFVKKRQRKEHRKKVRWHQRLSEKIRQVQ